MYTKRNAIDLQVGDQIKEKGWVTNVTVHRKKDSDAHIVTIEFEFLNQSSYWPNEQLNVIKAGTAQEIASNAVIEAYYNRRDDRLDKIHAERLAQANQKIIYEYMGRGQVKESSLLAWKESLLEGGNMRDEQESLVRDFE